MRLARRAAAAGLRTPSTATTASTSTKLDVLTGLDALKIGVEYAIDGEVLPRGYMPASLDELARVDVRYVELPGWTEDLSLCRAFADLPATARRATSAPSGSALGGRWSWVSSVPAGSATTPFVMPASVRPLARPARLAQVLAWCQARKTFQGVLALDVPRAPKAADVPPPSTASSAARTAAAAAAARRAPTRPCRVCNGMVRSPRARRARALPP